MGKLFAILILVIVPQKLAFADWGISVGNVLPSDDFYAATVNVGIFGTTELTSTSGGSLIGEFGYSISLLKADTSIPDVEYSYDVMSIGIAYESKGDFFIRPEFGFESITEELSDGAISVSADNSGSYYALGIGFRFHDGVGVLKYRPMGGEEDGFMWSYHAVF